MKKMFLALSAVFALLVSVNASAYDVQKIAGTLQISLDPYETNLESKMVDVLFIVDDSASMQNHQQNLAYYTDALANQLKGLDVHAGVLTTDPSPYNKPASGGVINWTDSRQPDWNNTLKRNLLVGTNGSANERPFESLALALKEPALSQNAGFFRASAHLVVVLLTDADDQSTMAAADFQKILTQFKGQPERIGFHGIIAPTGDAHRKDCTMEGDSSARIEDTIKFFNGITVSLCDPSILAGGIQAIGQDIANHAQSSGTDRLFTLPMAPDLKTMNVSYGSPLVGGDLEYGWSYISSSTQIKFGSLIDWKSQPQGTKIIINYVPQAWQK